jgi:hypothetical protein
MSTPCYRGKTMNAIAGATLLSAAGMIATAAAFYEHQYNQAMPCWQTTASALILGGIGLFLIFDKKSN